MVSLLEHYHDEIWSVIPGYIVSQKICELSSDKVFAAKNNQMHFCCVQLRTLCDMLKIQHKDITSVKLSLALLE